MKTKTMLAGLTAGLIAATFTACDKKAGADADKNPVSTTADAAKDLAGKAADTVKDAAAQATAAATNIVSAAAGPFAEGLASVKKAVADKNYQGALDELKMVSSLKLSDEQTKIVDNLKTEVQKLISGGTTNALNAAKNLLGK